MLLSDIYPVPSDKPLLFLAPMAEYTDAAMRRVCSFYGASLTYTEMVNAYSCARGDTKTWSLLETFADEGPVVAHIYGSEPEVMASAAKRIEECGRFVGIDVNAGCPMKRIMANGSGAWLIKDPRRIHDILAAIKREVSLPVSLKTRLGPRPDAPAIFDILSCAEEAGASAIAVHGRFTSQIHSGTVHLDILSQVKERANIPVIANGGVASAFLAGEMFRLTGCDAVMVARGAIGSPWVFRQILQNTEESRTIDDIRTALAMHLDGVRELISRRLASGETMHERDPDILLATAFRTHMIRYLRGLPGASAFRGKMALLKRWDEVSAAAEKVLALSAGED